MSIRDGGEATGSWTDLIVDSPAARTVARPPEHAVVVETGLRVPMRDGTALGAMLWRPATPGRSPVLVERGPHRLEERTGPAGDYYAARGYAVLGVSLRGCGASGGAFTGRLFGSPPGDATATIAWAARQPWSSGRVGMLCGSVSGWTQYQAATEAPPGLAALLVREGPFFRGYRDCWAGGAFPLAAIQGVAAAWTDHRRQQFTTPAQRAAADRLLAEYGAAPEQVARRLPLAPHPLFGGVADYYNELLAHPTEDDWWRDWDLRRAADCVDVPICHLGAWFDGIVHSTLAAFATLRDRAATAAARSRQRLVVGPWVHGPDRTGLTRVGDLELGPNAALDFMAFRGRWYDHALLGRATGVEADPRVWLYVIGPDQWIGCDAWPPPGMVATPWHLRAGDGDDGGRLAPEAPAAAEAPDGFTDDPDDPVPSLSGGGPFGMGLDERPIAHRLLTYTSPPLAGPLALIGPLTAVLHAAADAPDADWVVRLSLVRPDGAAIVISGGLLRARYRDSFARPTPLEPGAPARLAIEMMPLAIVIPAGCRLRLSIAGGDFPAHDRNLHTGGAIGREAAGRPARQQVFHDRLRPSHLVLPVME